MAPVSLIFQCFLLSLLHPSETQTIIGSSSFTHLGPSINSPPQPTKYTARFWPSLPPRGRSDVPIRATVRDRLTTKNAVQQGQTMPRPSPQSTPSFISALTTQNLSSGPILTEPTATRPRTDTASLAFSRAFAEGDDPTKGSTLPLTTLPSSAVADFAGNEPTAAGKSEKVSVKETDDDDVQGMGSGSAPTVMLLKEELPAPTMGDVMAQYQPQAQTAISKSSDVKTPPEDSQTLKPHLFVLTTAKETSTTPQTETRATLPTVVRQATPGTVVETGKKKKILEDAS